MGERAKKGTVSVDSFRGMLRLRLPRNWFNGKLKFLSLGLADTPENRLIAEAKIGIMQSDYIYERFDFSLEKYKLTTAEPEPEFSLADLFLQYLKFKEKTLARSSMKNLTSVHNKLIAMPDSVLRKPSLVRSWLIEHNTQNQAKKDLTQIKACCTWAEEEGLIDANPFESVKRIKGIAKNHQPDPFTAEERDLILEGFALVSPHYYNFVRFLFYTGCRPSEGTGLRWENVDLLSKKVIFCEAIVEGHYKSDTKTHRSRSFPINSQLEEILTTQPKVKDTVFYSEKGKFINLNNFNRRHWSKVFKQINVRRRDCYNTRHTFITLCLGANVPIQDIANWVGNSPQIILKHYAGMTRSSVPDL